MSLLSPLMAFLFGKDDHIDTFGVFIQLSMVPLTRHCPPDPQGQAGAPVAKPTLDDAYLSGHG